MDLGSFIIGITSLLLFVVPFIIMNNKSKKTELRKLNLINNIALQNNCIISKHEICGNYIIGIDEKKLVVFLMQYNNQDNLNILVNLSQIDSCRIIKNINDGYVSFFFIPNNNKENELKFTLTNSTNVTLDKELKFVEKWTKTINDLLAK